MIGIDTIRIARVAKAVKGEPFKKRVFTPAECAYCDETAQPDFHYAAMFCAKEAVVKALKCGFGAIMPADIEIRHYASGAPYVVAHGKAEALLDGKTVDISLSHDGDYAVAVAEIY